MEWFDLNERTPKEGEFPWVQIRKGEKVCSYPVKIWESNDGQVSFVNALFEREKGVTHFRKYEAIA